MVVIKNNHSEDAEPLIENCTDQPNASGNRLNTSGNRLKKSGNELNRSGKRLRSGNRLNRSGKRPNGSGNRLNRCGTQLENVLARQDNDEQSKMLPPIPLKDEVDGKLTAREWRDLAKEINFICLILCIFAIVGIWTAFISQI